MKPTAQESVLKVLRNANLDGLRGVSVWTLSIMTGYPQATIRRTIGELKFVYAIVRDGRLIRLVA